MQLGQQSPPCSQGSSTSPARQCLRSLIAAFKHLQWAYKQEGDWLFAWANSDRTRKNGFKQKVGRFRLLRRWWSTGAAQRCSGCSRTDWIHPWSRGWQPSPPQGGWNWKGFNVPSTLSHSMSLLCMPKYHFKHYSSGLGTVCEHISSSLPIYSDIVKSQKQIRTCPKTLSKSLECKIHSCKNRLLWAKNLCCSYTVVVSISWIFLVLCVKHNLFLSCASQYLLFFSLPLQISAPMEDTSAASLILPWSILGFQNRSIFFTLQINRRIRQYPVLSTEHHQNVFLMLFIWYFYLERSCPLETCRGNCTGRWGPRNNC